MRRAVIALALLLGACGGGADGTGSETGQAAPISFTAPAVGGGQIDADDYRGSDLVLWFWSPW